MISGNTNGENGACDGGVDDSTYSFHLQTTTNGALIFSAATMRSQTHTPGAGYTQRAELSQGSFGQAASIAVQDRIIASASMAAVNGTFSGAVDWAGGCGDQAADNHKRWR
jgi:hypothetical protein